ncbi:MAG: hypothetical protein ACOYJD_02605 [Christensenellales bacterium]|jgi:hypothetical protein
MEFVRERELVGKVLPGRIITKIVGGDSPIKSSAMSVGYGMYCEEAGVMEPHCHAEESVYILDQKDAIVRYGGDKDNLLYSLKLEKDMLLHFDENEWHVFEYEPGGFLKILFIYGTGDQVRPEDKK